MNYQIIFPKDYVKPSLPGRDEWCADLREGHSQTREYLQRNLDGEFGYCCLGRLCVIQNRLRNGADVDKTRSLDITNPLYPILNGLGNFPPGVVIKMEGGNYKYNLSECNDSGLEFPQIAEIIEAIWDHAPKNWSQEKIVYKLVKDTTSGYRSWYGDYTREERSLFYTPGKTVVPKFGMIFCFETLSHAQNYDSGSAVLKCRVVGKTYKPKQIPYGSCTINAFQKFWKLKRNKKKIEEGYYEKEDILISIQDAPHGTICCESVEVLGVV